MASHRRPKQASRARVTVLTATAAAAVALSAQLAQAEPTSKSDAKERVDNLYEQAEQATEKYNGAKEKENSLQKEVEQLQDKVAREQGDLNELQSSLGSVAAAQYRGGGIDPSVQLFFSADPDDYLDKASTIDQLSASQAAAFEKVQEQKRELDQQRKEATAKLAELEKTRTKLAKDKKEVQSKLAEAQRVLNTMNAKERAEQERASRGSDDRVDLGNSTSASQRAAAALSAAQSKIGSPYVWGATGPNSFDCSGLTSWAYAQAGVSIPRTSQSQASAGTRLTMSQLKPGDLVLFYSDLHHVGLYAGNGQVLHAPRSGETVRYESIGNMPFQFGVRI